MRRRTDPSASAFLLTMIFLQTHTDQFLHAIDGRPYIVSMYEHQEFY